MRWAASVMIRQDETYRQNAFQHFQQNFGVEGSLFLRLRISNIQLREVLPIQATAKVLRLARFLLLRLRLFPPNEVIRATFIDVTDIFRSVEGEIDHILQNVGNSLHLESRL